MYAFSIFCALLCNLTLCAQISFNANHIDAQTQEIRVHFNIPDGDFIYKDYLTITSPDPSITISNVCIPQSPTNTYSSAFKKNKDIYTQPFEIVYTAHAAHNAPIDPTFVIDYYQESHKKIAQHTIHAPFATANMQPQHHKTIASAANEAAQTSPSSLCTHTSDESNVSLTARLSHLITHTDSWLFQLTLALLLGLLLSLTPCIYPMIPITVGILQSQGSNSVGRNLMLACAYTCGIATTFACLGLLSAFTGQLFGSFMASPFVVLSIVALLAYLAGAMIGWYPMYTPSFMQQKSTSQKGGSIITAFSFGAASGTIASPCVSPGLILLLSIVTKLGSIIHGFALLFTFGVGLSIPLLIIGTFSSSLNVLPRAGMWMVEIKKLIGFMMFGICLYFLQSILPWFALLWIATILCTFIGYAYLKDSAYKSGIWYIFYSLIGMMLIGTSVWCGMHAYKATMQRNAQDTFWLDEFNDAKDRAIAENKKLLLDVTTPCCTICKAIDRKFFSHKDVLNALCTCVPVKINGADSAHETHMLVQKQYDIIGAPTLILIDPTNGNEIKRWGSELYDYSITEFVKEFSTLT